jgi:hypothetical protein
MKKLICSKNKQFSGYRHLRATMQDKIIPQPKCGVFNGENMMGFTNQA